MPMIEVDESQFGALKSTAQTLQGMLNNPKTRQKVLEAFKENNPNVAVPEIDAAAPVREQVTGVEKMMKEFIDNFQKERDQEKTETRLAKVKEQQDSGRKLLKDRGYTEDGIKALESFRDEKGIVEYGDAVYLFERDHAPPQVAEPSAGNMNFFGMVQNESSQNDFAKKLMESRGEDNNAVNQMAMQTIAEMRGQTRR